MAGSPAGLSAATCSKGWSRVAGSTGNTGNFPAAAETSPSPGWSQAPPGLYFGGQGAGLPERRADANSLALTAYAVRTNHTPWSGAITTHMRGEPGTTGP